MLYSMYIYIYVYVDMYICPTLLVLPNHPRNAILPRFQSCWPPTEPLSLLLRRRKLYG